MPIPNPINPNYFLLSLEARNTIDKKKLSLNQLFKFLLTIKNDSKEKRLIKEDKNKDSKYSFSAIKVRATIKCDNYGTLYCLYSNHIIDSKKGS